MTDEKLTAIYTASPVTVDPGDLAYAVVDTGTTPDEGAFKYSQLMFNRYKLSPSVSANDLILALKHEDGNDPSADRPLYFKIGDSLRACTAALSVTKADATNWSNLGSAQLATQESDLFCYIVWNTNLAPAAIDIFWSRIPYGRLYSDFSATTTAEKYAAINATAPAATDECINIGRFAATLSAGAGYTWTVPVYTAANLVSHPIYITRRLVYTGAATASAGAPTTAPVVCSYIVENGTVDIFVNVTITNKGTASAIMYVSVPWTPVAVTALTAQEITATGAVAGANYATTPRILVYKYDGTTIWVNGYVILAAGKIPLR